MIEAISAAEENKFSEFSKKVKTSLDDKLRNNPKMKSQMDNYKSLEGVKNAFAKIANDQEPETPEETETPSED